MDCPKCKAANPEGKHFCGECGTLLDPISEEFRRSVMAVVHDQLRDQKVVEIETAEAVVTRLKNMAKPIVYVSAVVVTVLGVLGFRSVHDVLTTLRNAQAQALEQLRNRATSDTQQLAKEAETIRAQYRRVGDQQDLIIKLKQAQAQYDAIQRAGRGLKERYEQLSAEFSQKRPSNSSSRTTASLSPETSINLREDSGGAGTPMVIYTGSSGAQVERIQRRLKELGCYGGEITGDFDKGTKDAVSRFNESRGDLLGSGVVDRSTWSALFDSRKTTTRCQ